MTEVLYKIRNIKTGNMIIGFTAGVDVTSTIGKTFKSYGDALMFLTREQEASLIFHSRYINLDNYIIEEYTLRISSGSPVKTNLIYNLDTKRDLNSEMLVSSVFKDIVLRGFNVIPESLLNFLLTDDKYHAIMLEIVPPHMAHSIDDFREVGILECELDILGSISFTATDEQLIMHNIPIIFKQRTETISK